VKKTLILFAGLASVAASAQNLRSEVYVTGLSLPVAMIQDPTDPNVQFVVEQRGLIRVIQNGAVTGTPFLNLVGTVHPSHSEGGLLGLAFHPQYATNRQFYVNYTDTGGTTRIARYTRNAGNPLLADPGSAQPVISIAQPFSNHNGGTIRFGPLDGLLYIGMGDGGSGNDPGNRAQTITNMLLGKMLRLDVDRDDFPADATKNYGIPPTNPFVGVTGDDEIWAFGIRNPWKWTFDPPAFLGTGGMLIADVGQSAFEEINYEPPLAGGRNYGWRVFEGNQTTGLGGGFGPPYTFPIHTYPRTLGVSITGGYVYRGLMLGDYFGRYFYADYGQARISSFDLLINPTTGEGTAVNVIDHTTDINSGAQLISSIDTDSNGELYICDYRGSGNGRIIKILPENRAWVKSVTPDLTTPVFGNVRTLSALDGKVLRTASQESQILSRLFESAFFANMEVSGTASVFDLFVDASTSESVGSASLQIFMRNWSTGQLDSIGTVPLTSAMTTHQILNIPAGPYRRVSDNAVQVRFYVSNNGVRDAARYTIQYDKLKLVLR